MKEKRNSIDYINATCAVREKHLVGTQRFLRMAEAESLSSAFDILRESNFGGEIVLSCSEYEKLIEEEERLLVEFVKEYCPSSEIEKFCLIANDFYNAEIIVKSQFKGLDSKKYLQTEGLFTVEQLNALAKGEKVSDLPAQLINAVELAKEELNKGKGGMIVGSIFARAKYEYLLKTVKTSYLKEIVKTQIDGINICSILRANDYNLAKEQIISGGYLGEKELEIIGAKDKKKISEIFKNGFIKDLALSAVTCSLNGEPLILTEKELSSMPAVKLLETKYTKTEGTYPFMRYYFRRKNQIACARTVLTGKANGLDSEKIKLRLLCV